MSAPPAPAAGAGAPPAPRPAAAAPPPGLPARFELLRRLGAGRGGQVHAALDREHGRLVALKLVPLPPGLELPRQRFDAAAAAARRLSHPDIVALLDAGSSPRLGWLALELVAGTTLERYARPPRLLPLPLALHACARVAAALAHAHGLGVLHRDLKPANVLVDLPAGTLKLGDFGLARLADAQATRTGVLLGSPAYMAPELLAGAPADAACDLYALGATLYELLTGRLPLAAEADAPLGELLRAAASAVPPPARSLRPDLPVPVDDLLARLLAKRPAQRPATAGAVAQELAALAGAAAPVRRDAPAP